MSVKLREKQLKSGEISFYLDIYHKGSRYYEFLDIHIHKHRPSEADKEKRQLAQEIRVRREHELILEDNGLQDRKKKQGCAVAYFEQYIKKRNNTQSYDSTLKKLQKYVGKQSLPFSRITPTWIKAFEKYILGENVSINSTVRYLAVFKGVLAEAVRDKIINRNPFDEIPRQHRLKSKEVFRSAFTIQQLQTLADTPVKNMDEQVKQGYFFSCFTGLRWSDISQLRWTNVIRKEIEGQEQYFIHFEQEKTEGIEYLPLSDNAIDILKERQQKQENSPYIFPSLVETEPGKKKRYFWVCKQLKKWAKAADIDPKKLHFHSARHTFATNVLESSADGDLYTVSKLLGHKDIKATQIYAKVRDKRKQAAVKALPRIDMNRQILKTA
jgi:site-specific recombinase XerD